MKIIRLILFLLLVRIAVIAQNGSLLLVGGGSESNDYPESWSTLAYSWAVEQTPNKKVAVIHYSSTGDWLKPYFTDHCGALASGNFVINESNANNQEMIDSLMGYDMFFFRGGDQYYYYNYYNGSLMEQAMKDKFSQGGVLAGTSAGLAILSEVIFWAGKGSAYSDVSIKNIENSHITLADDFMDAAPAMIFDSHFTNRGRLGRLVSFMASYEKEKDNRIMGVGVDETTALGITKDKLGIVFGTRSVSFYTLPEEENFGPGPALSARNLDYHQLVHGDTIDLKTMEVYGLPRKVTPSVPQINPGQVVFLSGSDELASLNKAMLGKFAGSGDGKGQEIILLTGASTLRAKEIQALLLDLEAENVSIVQATFDFSEDPYTQSKIESATKILFADNSTYNFNVFLNSGTNGEILQQRLKEPGLILAFIGDNSRYAGSQIVNNYLSGGSNISLTKGLSLLDGMSIIPKTFDPPGGATDAWYTTQLALPFAMVSDELPFGLWLNNDNYVVFASSAGENLVTAYGISPVMLLEMKNGRAGFTTMTYNGQQNEIPVPAACFDNMKLSFLPDGESVNLGAPVSVKNITNPMDEVQIFPNPVSDYLLFPNTFIPDEITIVDLHGRVLHSIHPSISTAGLDVGFLKPGIYFLELSVEDRKSYSRFIKLDE